MQDRMISHGVEVMISIATHTLRYVQTRFPVHSSERARANQPLEKSESAISSYSNERAEVQRTMFIYCVSNPVQGHAILGQSDHDKEHRQRRTEFQCNVEHIGILHHIRQELVNGLGNAVYKRTDLGPNPKMISSQPKFCD